jgi:hypothetical protein
MRSPVRFDLLGTYGESTAFLVVLVQTIRGLLGRACLFGHNYRICHLGVIS